nr:MULTISPECIES: transposase [Pseudomonas putida group]
MVCDLFIETRRRGRPRVSDRLMLDGILWVLWLDGVSLPSSQRDRPRKRCKWLLADKGYDAEALRRYRDQYRMKPVIPLRSMKRKPKPGLPRLFDRPKYRQRNILERMFDWLKKNSRIVTRVDKLAKSYAAMVSLACPMRCLRQRFSDRA